MWWECIKFVWNYTHSWVGNSILKTIGALNFLHNTLSIILHMRRVYFKVNFINGYHTPTNKLKVAKMVDSYWATQYVVKNSTHPNSLTY